MLDIKTCCHLFHTLKVVYSLGFNIINTIRSITIEGLPSQNDISLLFQSWTDGHLARRQRDAVARQPHSSSAVSAHHRHRVGRRPTASTSATSPGGAEDGRGHGVGELQVLLSPGQGSLRKGQTSFQYKQILERTIESWTTYVLSSNLWSELAFKWFCSNY